MDVRGHNRSAWDRMARAACRWSIPVGPAELAQARAGNPAIRVTPTRAVPRDWLPATPSRICCLASGGGQQGPLLAAAGHRVVVFDNSPAQLQLDRDVAAREGLALETVEGDMRDLSALESDSFDCVVHPIANCFVPEVHSLWREVARVLRPGGALVAGFTNPVSYLLDWSAGRDAPPVLRYSVPYSDVDSLAPEVSAALMDAGEALEFGHSLEDQIGGQIAAGLLITGFFEDRYGGEPKPAIDRYLPVYIATRAIRAG